MKDNLIKRIKKEQKGSITLFVLASCMFFLVITLLININIVVKKNNQEKQIAQIIENYEVSNEKLEEAYHNLYQETGIYVALKGDTLCFYNNQKEAKENADNYYGNIKEEVYTREWSSPPNTPWYADSENIKKVEFCTEIRPINMACYFSDLTSLTEIIGLENLHTDQVSSMFALFYNCTSLPTIDVSRFKTRNVTSMGVMFYNCASITNIKGLANLDTSKVIDMISMFDGCKSLTELNLSNFNTQNVTAMAAMFRNCSSLKGLNLSNFNTQNITDMSFMFYSCSDLTELDLSSFNTQSVTDMECMFSACSQLTSINLSNWKTPNVDSFRAMFLDCKELKVVNCNEFTIKEGAYAGDMFNGCISITELNISKMDLYKAGEWSWAFANVPNTAKITTNKAMKTWIETVYNPNSYANFTNIQTID